MIIENKIYSSNSLKFLRVISSKELDGIASRKTLNDFDELKNAFIVVSSRILGFREILK